MSLEKWYVLYTAPRAEKKVAKRLSGEGIEVFLPLYQSKRKWSDRIKMVELPLFASYIFVHCNDIRLRTLTAFHGVVRVLYYNGRPAVVKDEEIAAINEFIPLANGNRLISKGDMMKILAGPYVEKTGKVVKYSKKYSYLYIEETGYCLWVENLNLEKEDEETENE